MPTLPCAQDRKKIVVGLLSWWPSFMEPTYVARLREGLKAYGYVEGRNLELLVTFTGGNVERAREAAKAYVDRGVDVIVATATPAVTIAKQATEAKKIPIVMTPVSDPIATGFAASIARPGRPSDGHVDGRAGPVGQAPGLPARDHAGPEVDRLHRLDAIGEIGLCRRP